MLIAIMHTTQLQNADLNLLVVFAILAEERNMTRAAERLCLSQPAVSRALQRTRQMFHDDLLIRTSAGYEPTPLGQRLLRELEIMLPRLNCLFAGAGFDPAHEAVTFRISSTDYASQVVCPTLCQAFMPESSKVVFEFTTWSDTVFSALEHGQIDLLLNADDGVAPANLVREVLFEEELVCVVAQEHQCSPHLTLKQYQEMRHIGISTFGGVQNLPERSLALAGVKRRCALRLPYFAAAIRAVASTLFVATVPRRIAEYEVHAAALKIVEAPKELSGFKYQMVWHPRMNTDAAHLWLRSVVRKIGKKIAEADAEKT